MKASSRSKSMRLFVAVVVTAVLAGAAPAMAAVIREAGPNPVQAKFASALDPKPISVVKLGRVIIATDESGSSADQQSNSKKATDQKAGLVSVKTMAAAPIAAPAASTANTPDKPKNSTSSTTTKRTAAPSGDETAQARAILAGLISQHPILAGTTVTFAATPGGYQAVSYYQSGRIIISPSHTVGLSTILNHEIWHIIDWRDNGRIDWGENIPPS